MGSIARHLHTCLAALIALPAAAQVEFRDVTQEQGIFHPAHTEHAFFDFNNDGLLDLLTDT